ncbi:MAG TPA: response regulator [Nitrosopumilus sp.]
MTSVIVIDDNEDLAYSISELLEMYGVDVVGKAHDGLEGSELFDQLRPDAVLLDLMMPEYDGIYALRKIREIDPTSVVLIVTGGSPDLMSEELDSLRPTKILFKPFDVNNLVEVILEETNNTNPFRIEYSFNDDSKSYACLITLEQYKNFKKLPVIAECKITKNEEKNMKLHEDEMQKALDLAAKNDISHIQKLSQIVE